MSDSKEYTTLKMILDIATVILLTVGAGSGIFACWEYHRSNLVNTESMLVEMDRQVYQKVLEKSYLQAFFAQTPSRMDPAIGSRQLLQLFLEEKYSLSFTWKDIPDLYNKLFQNEGFNKPDRVMLRNGYFLAEDILYLLSNSYGVYKSHAQSKEDLETWIAYIDDIGQQPLFLAAIYCAHKYGYFDSEFAAFLVERMSESRNIKATLKAVYPDMLTADWAKKTGQDRLNKL